MIKTLIVTLLIALPLWLSAQTLTGRVYRASADSSTVIANASVYYGGSMVGTLSDARGQFTIEAKSGKMALIISCIGYYSATVTNYSPDKPLKIYLKPKLHTLREVRIGNDGLSRDDKVWMFKREFIGTSDYALSCTITNIEDIELDYNKKTGTLTAFCDEPIKIENKKLGYHISYYLDNFVRTPKNVVFAGNYIFSEDAAIAKQKKIIHNREDAYNGSRMEFIRALWSNTLKKNHYKIYTPYLDQLDADSIICLGDHFEKLINLKYKIVILHNNNFAYSSQMSQTISDCYIDENGFHDTGLQWYGDMGVKRVGDMLPFEYKSVKTISDSIHVADSTKLADKTKAQKAVAITLSKLDSKALKDFALFKTIVLSPKSPIDTTPVIKKWNIPIRYKIYGRFGADKAKSNMVFKKVDNLFAQLSRLTGLSISKAEKDSDVNFFIITEGLAKVKPILTPEAMDYLAKIDRAGGEYYTSNENGFISMVGLVRPANLPGVQRQIMSCLGFPGEAEDYQHSIFYQRPIDLPDKLQPLDSRIIQTLYNSGIKTGLTEQELNAALLKIFKGKKADLK